jgi:Ca-activated chloride channel family protein
VRPALKALFGARRVLGLEYLINSGYSVKELKDQLERLQYDAEEILGQEVVSSKVYAENVREDARKALRSVLVREALEYGLASAETAFVAVRTEAGQPVEGTVPVANALPVGWSEDFLLLSKGVGAGVAFRSARDTSPGIPALLRRRPDRYTLASTLSAPYLASPAGAMPEAAKPAEPTVVFSGVPGFTGDEAVLFDSSRDEDGAKVPESATIRLVQVRFPEGEPDADSLDPGLALVIFVGDLASPRAKVALADLVRRRGQRPLNIAKAKGDVVRLVLADPQGAWKGGAPKIEVALAW